MAGSVFELPSELIISRLLIEARRYLEHHRVVNPDWQAELILGHFLGMRRHELYLERGKPVRASRAWEIVSALKRRAEGEPTQYILGETEFYGLRILCDRRALIPRPETDTETERPEPAAV